MDENKVIKELHEGLDKINSEATAINKWATAIKLPEEKKNELSNKLTDLYATVHNFVHNMQFHVKAAKVKECIHNTKEKPFIDAWSADNGDLVQIRPCNKEYGDKTYLGILLGMAALSSYIEIKEDKFESHFSAYNPAIFVPELKKIIYGCESWWGKIKSVEELTQITNKDIENVWYVKLLKGMLEEKEVKNNEG